ncbi:hypothetical protein [Aquifex sp.]
MFKGFSLATVMILSTLLTVLGITVFLVTNVDIRATFSDVNFYLAENAAKTGILTALDRYSRGGFCVNQTFSGSTGEATYTVDITRSGRICFIRSRGEARGAKVVKTAMVQSYYGVGLYTVRGNVDASYGGGRLSGCDTSVNPVCYVPAFIASGWIRVSKQEPVDPCSEDRGGQGIYGDPALLPEVDFYDLTPLFFNVDCFSSKSDITCEYGLNNALEDTYATNWINDNKDFEIDEYGQVIVNLPEIPLDACIVRKNVETIDLSNITSSICEDPTSDTTFLYIRYSPVTLRGTPSEPTIIFSERNLNIGKLDGGTPNGENDFGAPKLNLTIYGRNISIYLYDDVSNVRMVLQNGNIRSQVSGIRISNSILILGYERSEDGDTQYNTNKLILEPTESFSLRDSAFFGTSIKFRNFSQRNYILNSLVYLYANACPSCSRNSSNASVVACKNDINRCAWAGYSQLFSHSVTFGTDRYPSILININSVVAGDSNSFTGVYFGHDVNYIWGYRAYVKGVLLRNFPPNLTLDIGFNQDTDFSFSKRTTDKIADNFWFFRKISCIRDDIRPIAQVIQTMVTHY